MLNLLLSNLSQASISKEQRYHCGRVAGRQTTLAAAAAATRTLDEPSSLRTFSRFFSVLKLLKEGLKSVMIYL